MFQSAQSVPIYVYYPSVIIQISSFSSQTCSGLEGSLNEVDPKAWAQGLFKES